MTGLDYPIVVEPLPEADGGGFVGYVPDLPGCFSDGATPEEALHNAVDAAGCWIEEATALGRPIPVPTRRMFA